MTSNRPSLADELNARIDCEDLAYKLGLERPGDRGNFRSPSGADKSPSLSVYADKASGRSRFKDFKDDVSGGPVDLYMHVRNCDVSTALRELSDMFNIRLPQQAQAGAAAGGPPRESGRGPSGSATTAWLTCATRRTGTS